jgi:hypothetical protein
MRKPPSTRLYFRRTLARFPGPAPALALALVLAGVAGCAGTPAEPDPAALKEQAAGRLVGEIAVYAIWVRRQSDETLRDELTRLEQAKNSPDETLRMTLIVGQRQSSLYDPERAARLLADLASQGADAAVHAQLAEVLLGLLPPEERVCGEAVCEEKLTLLVQMEERRRRELAARLDAMKIELDTERAARAKLENQLEALKSLEEQIQNRDDPEKQ